MKTFFAIIGFCCVVSYLYTNEKSVKKYANEGWKVGAPLINSGAKEIQKLSKN